MDYCSLFDVLNAITCFRLSSVNKGFYNEFKRRYPNLGEELKRNANLNFNDLSLYDTKWGIIDSFTIKYECKKTNQTKFFSTGYSGGRVFLRYHLGNEKIWYKEMGKYMNTEKIKDYLIDEGIDFNSVEIIPNPISVMFLANRHPTLFEVSLKRLKQSFQVVRDKTENYPYVCSYIFKETLEYNMREDNYEEELIPYLKRNNPLYLN